MKRLIFTKAFVLLAFMSGLAQSQQAKEGETVQIAVNPEFDKKGKFKRIIWGDHYRKEWAATVELPVFDLNNTAGGLKPVKMGGGMQTKSLRLRGNDGKEYVLRSVNKDPSAALPAEFKGTFADDVLQDQISSANPFAPLAVASLAEAAGIFHTDPIIVYVPANAGLGEFEQAFANTVCLFEERPADNKKGNAAFDYTKNIISTDNLLEKVFSNAQYRVDERAFLKARLFDMLIGDWDRHEGQWLWAGFEVNGKTMYKPIPRDRDQAFASLDGIAPSLASQRWALRKTKNFDDEIKDVNGLNMSGNALDRNFTTGLTRSDWLEVTRELRSLLTDNVIEFSVRRMPDVIFNLSGEDIIRKLKKRRDDLDKYAMEYYAFLTKEVNITGTSQQETFRVQRKKDSTIVSMYAGVHEQAGKLVYSRSFSNRETKEIRLYGLGGKDVFTIEGKSKKGVLVRVIGGEGHDKVSDSSSVAGMAHKTKVYDDANNTLEGGNKTDMIVSDNPLRNDYNRKTFTYDWLGPKLFPGYNPDDGVYFGGGVTFKKQQFGKQPYGYMHSIFGNYAFATGSYNFGYKGIFKDVVDQWDLHFDATINAPNYVRNFYGLGNDTKQLVDDPQFYRLRADQLTFSSGMYRQYGRHTIGGGVSYERTKVTKHDDRFVGSEYSGLDSTDFGKKQFTAGFATYQFSTLDNELFPRRGIQLKADARYVRNLDENQSFVKLSYQSSFFITQGRWTMAFRSGIASILNDEYEFFQANTLGGTTNLRGFRRDRFAGKTSYFNNTEVRFRINSFKGYFLGGQYGLLSFIDNGRVWMPGESSNTWHHGFGGGVWVLIYNKIPITATYGASKDDKVMSIKAGFLF